MEYDEFEELSKIAYKGEELSDLAPLPKKYMYIKLVNLYESFSTGKFSKEKCVELKNKYKKEYKEIMAEHEKDMECYREYLANRRDNEVMLARIEKSQNKEECLDLCLKIISNCVHDKTFYERNKAKGEQLAF